jgi:predicted nucleotidyltransferase
MAKKAVTKFVHEAQYAAAVDFKRAAQLDRIYADGRLLPCDPVMKKVAAASQMSRVVRGEFPDRQFDVDFWQLQGDEAIFDAGWELVRLAQEVKGSNVELKPDFKDLLLVLNQNQVTYLIVGGYAVMKYTEPFYTKDLDVWIDPTPENAERTYKALLQFGAPVADLTVHDLTQPRVVFQFGMAPLRVDLMTSIDAVSFAEAWENRVESHFGGVPISLISLRDLIQNKAAANRDTDRIQLAGLRMRV